MKKSILNWSRNLWMKNRMRDPECASRIYCTNSTPRCNSHFLIRYHGRTFRVRASPLYEFQDSNV